MAAHACIDATTENRETAANMTRKGLPSAHLQDRETATNMTKKELP
jgi:hypothetical protein